MAGGCQRGDAHPSTHLDDLPVRHGGAVEGHVVLAVDEVLGTGALREREAAGDVVVVDVGLEDVRQAYAVLLEEVEHAVDVALWVDDERDLAVVDEVAAVAERRGLDGDDGEVLHHRPTATTRPDAIQAWVPPATETASKPWATSRSVIALERLPEAQIDVHAGGAVDLVQARGQLAHGHEDGSGDVALGVLGALADVDRRACGVLGGEVL